MARGAGSTVSDSDEGRHHQIGAGTSTERSLVAPNGPIADALCLLDSHRDLAARLGAAGVATVERGYSARAMAEGFAKAVKAAVDSARGHAPES
jgi:glycosyltransferase involved in cell wall biosynthesis